MHGFQFQNSVWIAYSPRGAETLCCLLSIETELILGYNYNRVGSTFLQLDCYSPFCCSFIVIIILLLSFLFCLFLFCYLFLFFFYSPTSTFTIHQLPASSHHFPFPTHIAHHTSFTLHLLLPTILLSPPSHHRLFTSFTLLSIPSGVLRCTSIFLMVLLWGEG